MNNPTAKRKKFYCAAVYTSDAYALDVTDAIAAAGTEPAWQDAEIFKKQLFAKSVNADGYALWAEYIGTPNTVMPANGDVSALTDKLQSTGDFTRAAIDALIVATMGKAKYTLSESVNALTIVFPAGSNTVGIAKLRSAVNRIRPLHVTVDIGIAGTEEIMWHQCPEAVRSYLQNVTYNSDDYSTSQIASYAPANAVVSNYKPIGQEAGGVMHYNEVPNIKTPFAGGGKAGTLEPLDFLRWIKTRENSAEAWNVRDLGGWACDGGTVRYGLLFRGGKLAAADRTVLVGELGIQHDLDLRGREGGGTDDEPDMMSSPLGRDVRYTRAQKYAWYALSPVETWRTYLRCVIDAVTHREPVYFHCTAGADRTGTLACVLEGLLGMSQSDIDKDYELTCFYSGTATDALARRRNEADWRGLISAIKAVSGDSFRDKCVHFAVETCGMSMSDINAYRAAMIDGAPETLHWYQSITKNLTGCTISNGAAQVDYGERYTATLTPESGKKLTSVAVIMGGTDISGSAVTGETINIERVTGDVTITAVATVAGPTNIIDTIGISANTRLSTSSGDNRAQTGYAAIGANKDAGSLIRLSAGDKLRIKGAKLPSTNDNYSAIVRHSADGAFLSSTYLHDGLEWNGMTFANSGDMVIVTVKATSENHNIRVSLICTDAAAVVATINEEIT